MVQYHINTILYHADMGNPDLQIMTRNPWSSYSNQQITHSLSEQVPTATSTPELLETTNASCEESSSQSLDYNTNIVITHL